MSLTIKIILGALITTFIGILTFKLIDSAPFTPNNTVDDVTLKNTIGISGYVVSPGNYLLEADSTMGDLIEKAGGVNDKADTRAFLPDAIVEKSVQYYIPPRYNPTDICATEEIQKVNINSFTDAEELNFIEGIGNTISQSIISYRNENGLFQTLEDIMKVNGIGNATYTKLRNYIILVD